MLSQAARKRVLCGMQHTPWGMPHIQILFNTIGNCYTVIYTILLLRSLKDNNKKITLTYIVALMSLAKALFMI